MLSNSWGIDIQYRMLRLMKTVSKFLMLQVLLVASVLSSCSVSRQPVITREFVYTQSDFPSCHASTIVECPDGELLAAFFGGTREGSDDVCVYMCRKPKGGDWTGPELVAEDPQYPCWNPVLFYATDRLLLFYKTGPTVSAWVGHVKESTDNGRSWSEAYDFPEGMYGAIKDKPVRLSSGRIICPSSDERGGKWRVHFELSDDNGVTWRKVGPVASCDTLQAIQPSVIVYPDGTLRALCRSLSGKVASTTSTDNGESWSKMELLKLPNNNSGLDAVTLKDGRFALVCNPVTNSPGHRSGPRTPLCLMISKDGINWEKVATLEGEEGEYSYPAIIQGKDGTLHIVYTWRRELIKYTRIRKI